MMLFELEWLKPNKVEGESEVKHKRWHEWLSCLLVGVPKGFILASEDSFETVKTGAVWPEYGHPGCENIVFIVTFKYLYSNR